MSTQMNKYVTKALDIATDLTIHDFVEETNYPINPFSDDLKITEKNAMKIAKDLLELITTFNEYQKNSEDYEEEDYDSEAEEEDDDENVCQEEDCEEETHELTECCSKPLCEKHYKEEMAEDCDLENCDNHNNLSCKGCMRENDELYKCSLCKTKICNLHTNRENLCKCKSMQMQFSGSFQFVPTNFKEIKKEYTLWKMQDDYHNGVHHSSIKPVNSNEDSKKYKEELVDIIKHLKDDNQTDVKGCVTFITKVKAGIVYVNTEEDISKWTIVNFEDGKTTAANFTKSSSSS